QAGLEARSQMNSNTRSRGASTEMVRENGPTGPAILLANRPRKTWTFRTSAELSLAISQYVGNIDEPPNVGNRTESGRRPPRGRHPGWSRLLRLRGMLVSSPPGAGGVDPGVPELRRHQLPPPVDVRAAHPEEHRDRPSRREAGGLARRRAGLDPRGGQVP